MRSFIVGLTAGLAGAALAQLAPPDTRAGTHAHTVVAAAAHPAGDPRDADPYAPLWHCREEVRSFLSVSTESVRSRQQALEECIAAAGRERVEVAAD